MSGIVWQRPPSALAGAVADYRKRLLTAVYLLGAEFARRMQAYAQQHAPWQDRTGNARRELFARAYRLAAGVVIVLSHGRAIDYGIYLEVKNQGKYAVILPTLEAHYGPVMAAVKELVG